jgi:hypothetical protein
VAARGQQGSPGEVEGGTDRDLPDVTQHSLVGYTFEDLRAGRGICSGIEMSVLAPARSPHVPGIDDSPACLPDRTSWLEWSLLLTPPHLPLPHFPTSWVPVAAYEMCGLWSPGAGRAKNSRVGPSRHPTALPSALFGAGGSQSPAPPWRSGHQSPIPRPAGSDTREAQMPLSGWVTWDRVSVQTS